MPDQSLLAQSKMSAPDLPEVYVPRLDRIGADRSGSRMVIVQGPPGYGKTLLARELLDGPDRVVWHRLDARDKDPEVFLNGLLAAVEDCCPEVVAITAASAASAGAGYETMLGLIRRALAGLAEPVRFVLDDAHHLEHGGRGPEILEALAYPRNVPAQVICTTRQPMTLPWGLTSSHDSIRVITEQELAFTPGEAVELFRVHGRTMDEDTAAELLRPLDGWPAAVADLARGTRAGAGAEPGCLDDRLVNQLVSGLLDEPTGDAHHFLMRTAVLRRFNVALCARLAGPDAERALRSVRARSPFVLALDTHGSWFRYHSPLRHILEARLRAESGLDGLRQAHRSAAEAWQREGDDAEAIHHLILAGDFTQAARSVSATAPGMLEAGAVTQVGEWLDGLPPSQRQENPALAHLEGVVGMHSGYLHEARAAFLRAREKYADSGDTHHASRSAYWLASTMVSHPQALEALDLSTDRIDPNDQWQPFVDLCLWQSMLLANRKEEAEQLHRRAVSHPQAQQNLPFVAYRHAIDAMYDLRGRGELQTGLDQLQDAARVMRKSDPLSRLPVVLAYGVVLLWDMGRTEEARQWLEQARETTRSKGTAGFYQAWLSLMRARLDLRDGRVDIAAAALERLRAHRRSGGYVWRAHQIDLLAAEVALERDGADADLNRVHVAYDRARAYGYRHEVAWVATELAASLVRAGLGGPAAEYAALAVEACDPEHAFWSRRAAALVESVGAAAGRTPVQPEPSATARTPPAHAPVAAPAHAPAPDSPHLQIQTLSGFAVRRDGTLMAAADWGRRRARQLFKLLLSSGRPLHAEEIIDLMWPGESGVEAAQRGLNTAVYWLRRALEPGLRRGPESRYVVANAQCYRLVLHPGDTWDVAWLRTFSPRSDGTANLKKVLAAFDLACADYLPSDRYEQWADPVRDELLRHRETLLSRAVAEARRASDTDAECAVLERALEADHFREDIAKDLLRLYTAAGRHDSARRLYERRHDFGD